MRGVAVTGRDTTRLCASAVGKLLRTKFVHVGLLLLGFDGNLMPGLLSLAAAACLAEDRAV